MIKRLLAWLRSLWRDDEFVGENVSPEDLP